MEARAALDILTIAIVVLANTTVFATIAWIKARERAIRAEQKVLSIIGSDQRLDRIEQAIDAVALDVERIAETERFASKLLAEGRANGLETRDRR
jgi:hypothetical protein